MENTQIQYNARYKIYNLILEHVSDKLDSINKLPFSKMGKNKVSRDSSFASPSDKIKIPLSLDFSLDPIIFQNLSKI